METSMQRWIVNNSPEGFFYRSLLIEKYGFRLVFDKPTLHSQRYMVDTSVRTITVYVHPKKGLEVQECLYGADTNYHDYGFANRPMLSSEEVVRYLPNSEAYFGSDISVETENPFHPAVIRARLQREQEAAVDKIIRSIDFQPATATIEDKVMQYA